MAGSKAETLNVDNSNITVLRIGVIKDRQVCHEQLLQLGESFSIGGNSLNSFVMDKEFCPESVGERFTLFDYSGNSYRLLFSNDMKGIVESNSQKMELSALRDGHALNGAKVSRKKEGDCLVLDDGAKGKIEIGSYSFLFQFVSAPAIVMRNTEFDSASILDEADWIFLGLLGFWGLAACFAWFTIHSMPRPELLNKEEIQDLLAEYLDVPPPEEPELTPEPTDDEIVDPNKVAEKAETKPTETKPEETETAAKPKDVSESRSNGKSSADLSDGERAEATEEVSRSFLFQALGTLGDGQGSVASAFGDESGGDIDLDATLDGVSDGRQAQNSTEMSIKGQIDKSGKASGGVQTGQTGSVKDAGTTSAPKSSAPTSVAKSGKIESSGMGTCAGLEKTVNRYISQIKNCHDISLKSNANVSGRVVVNLEVVDGVVTLANVGSNTTGDSSVASCITRKIKKWKFPEECSEIASLPFILEPK